MRRVLVPLDGSKLAEGRTGPPRVILGSVADALVQHVHCPIIAIAALVAGGMEGNARDESEIGSARLAEGQGGTPCAR